MKHIQYLWSFLYFHKTHPAVSSNRETIMVTKPRYLYSSLFTGLRRERNKGKFHLSEIVHFHLIKHSGIFQGIAVLMLRNTVHSTFQLKLTKLLTFIGTNLKNCCQAEICKVINYIFSTMHNWANANRLFFILSFLQRTERIIFSR